MVRIVKLLMLACLAGVGWAQDGAEPPKPSPAAEARVVAIEKEAEELFAAWRAESKRQLEELTKAAKLAELEGRERPPMPMMAMRPDYAPLVARLIGWADEATGEDAALYLARAVQFDGVAKDSRGRAAFERLVSGHASSPSWKRLGSLLPNLGRAFSKEERAQTLEVLGRHLDPDVRGWVALAQHGQTIEKADLDSQEYRDARAALLAAHGAAQDEELKRELSGPIDLREKLAVGAVSPDIEGLDLAGEAFKLSDYRGKVILLSFWGDW